jgi:hypothetical protein
MKYLPFASSVDLWDLSPDVFNLLSGLQVKVWK